MNAEDLLKTLKDGGLDDEAIKSLLSDALASLEGPVEEEANKQKASQLLGVNL